MIFSGTGFINLCTVCAETPDELQGTPVVQSHIIGIDPGHQGPNVDMSDLEPLGSGSTEMKAKASTGTQGTFSGLHEYQLNLDVSLKLQQILEDRGYQTVLTRTDNDTAISNKERAEYVAGQGADVYVRIHANGAESSSAAGATYPFPPPLPILMYPSSMMIPTAFPSAFWMPTVTQPDLKTAA